MPSRVLLPQPDGPIRVRNSPALTVRSTGSNARKPLGKVFSADLTSMTGVLSLGAISLSTTFLMLAERAILRLNRA